MQRKLKQTKLTDEQSRARKRYSPKEKKQILSLIEMGVTPKDAVRKFFPDRTEKAMCLIMARLAREKRTSGNGRVQVIGIGRQAPRSVFTTLDQQKTFRDILTNAESSTQVIDAVGEAFNLNVADPVVRIKLGQWFQRRKRIIPRLDESIAAMEAEARKPKEPESPAEPQGHDRFVYQPPALKEFGVELEILKVIMEIRDSIKHIEAVVAKAAERPSEIVMLEPAGGRPSA